MLAPEEYFGKELAQSLRKLFGYAVQITPEERTILVKCLRAEVSEQTRDTVCITLTKIAERIESMGVVK